MKYQVFYANPCINSIWQSTETAPQPLHFVQWQCFVKIKTRAKAQLVT